MNLFRCLRALFRKEKIDADMAEEMRAHLELQSAENERRGLSPAEARSAAQRAFGGVEQIKEHARDQRGWLWLEHAVQDFRFALRMLRKSPVFTFVAIVSLAIGIGLNTAVFSIINTIFHQSIRGVPEPQRVLIFNDGAASVAGYRLLRDQSAEVAALAAARGLSAVIGAEGGDRSGRVLAVAADYFAVLGARPAFGRFFLTGGSVDAATYDAPEAVLAHAFWEKHLAGDRAILGRVLRVNGTSVAVVGVAAPEFHGPGPEGPAMWVPLGLAPGLTQHLRPQPSDKVGLIGRLRPGVTLAQAQATVAVVAARAPEIFGETRYRLSLGREDWRGGESPEKRVELVLVTTVPLIVVGGLLWIACSNVGNLLLSRAVQRRKEIAIRVASGASRGRLVRMMLVESLLLALGGGVAGLWVSRVTVDFVFATLSNFGAFSVQLDLRVLLYTSAVSVVAALLFGLVPALQASKADVNQALNGASANPAFRSSRLRAFFLASQIASSVALLVVAGTFVKSLVGGAYLGARARQMDHLLLAQLPASERVGLEREAFFRLAAAQTRAIPGVEAAALVETSNAPRGRFRRPGEVVPASAGVDPAMEVAVQRISDAYFDTVGITRQRGAPLSAVAPRGALREAIINEAMARQFWTPDTAVGQRFEIDAQSYTVTGLASDGAERPAIYTQLSLTDSARLGLLVRTRGKSEDFVAPVSAALRGLMTGSDLPMVNTYRAAAFHTLSEFTRLAVFIGGLALALAAAGIYASMAFSTSQRTREIGVRMALGATRPSVLRLVLGSGLRTVVWGSALGLVIALVGVRLLFGLMGGGAGIDPVAIVAVMVFFTAMASLACLLPAYRAAKVDPMVALRAE